MTRIIALSVVCALVATGFASAAPSAPLNHPDFTYSPAASQQQDSASQYRQLEQQHDYLDEITKRGIYTQQSKAKSPVESPAERQYRLEQQHDYLDEITKRDIYTQQSKAKSPVESPAERQYRLEQQHDYLDEITKRGVSDKDEAVPAEEDPAAEQSGSSDDNAEDDQSSSNDEQRERAIIKRGLGFEQIKDNHRGDNIPYPYQDIDCDETVPTSGGNYGGGYDNGHGGSYGGGYDNGHGGSYGGGYDNSHGGSNGGGYGDGGYGGNNRGDRGDNEDLDDEFTKRDGYPGSYRTFADRSFNPQYGLDVASIPCKRNVDCTYSRYRMVELWDDFDFDGEDCITWRYFTGPDARDHPMRCHNQLHDNECQARYGEFLERCDELDFDEEDNEDLEDEFTKRSIA